MNAKVYSAQPLVTLNPCRKPKPWPLAGASALVLCWTAMADGPFLNGFDLSNSSIPVTEIVRGGPPRDGIPAIDNPRFLKAEKPRPGFPLSRHLRMSCRSIFLWQ